VVENCPYCGASTKGTGRLRLVRLGVEVFGWVVLGVFVISLVGCVAFLAVAK
jgi:hypothetical protein